MTDWVKDKQLHKGASLLKTKRGERRGNTDPWTQFRESMIIWSKRLLLSPNKPGISLSRSLSLCLSVSLILSHTLSLPLHSLSLKLSLTLSLSLSIYLCCKIWPVFVVLTNRTNIRLEMIYSVVYKQSQLNYVTAGKWKGSCILNVHWALCTVKYILVWRPI